MRINNASQGSYGQTANIPDSEIQKRLSRHGDVKLMLSELQEKETPEAKPAPSITERLQAATAEVERREQQREDTTKPRNPER